MEVSVLVSILGPCLGVLLTGVNAVAQEIGKSAAPELLEHAKRLWAKLRPHVESEKHEVPQVKQSHEIQP